MALLVSGTIGCSSPVQNSAAGIGPVTNRRRARRVGTDSDSARQGGGPLAWNPCPPALRRHKKPASHGDAGWGSGDVALRSEEHTSELQSLMRISYAVLCLKKKQHKTSNNTNIIITRRSTKIT